MTYQDKLSEKAHYPVYRAMHASEILTSNQMDTDEIQVGDEFLVARAGSIRPAAGNIPNVLLKVTGVLEMLNARLERRPTSWVRAGRTVSKPSHLVPDDSIEQLVARYIEMATKHIFKKVDAFGKVIYFPSFESSPFVLDALLSALIEKLGTGNQILPEHIAGYEDLLFAFERDSFTGYRDSQVHLASRVRYLGPLRAREHSPGLSYSYSRDPLVPLGAKGEKMAEFLLREHSEKRYPRIDGTTGKMRLVDAVNHWLFELFDVGQRLTVENEGIYGPVARLGVTKFQHLGTGVSQLMPVLVLVLSADPGTTVILEQPELHLHPAWQQKLADFFVHMARTRRQIMVETQSEYMLTRIRRHLADGSLEPADASVVFASKGSLESHRILADGSLDAEWPEDFFDFTLDDTIALMNAVNPIED